MNIRLRFGLPHERGPLEELQRRASLMWEEYRPYLLASPEAIELPLAQLTQRQVRVAEWAGRVAGFSAMLPRDGYCELDGLFVEPALWNRGVGRALIADALAGVRAQGGVTLETVANPRAEGFYRRLGFVVSGQAQTQFGPANRMRISAFSAQT